MGLGGRRRSRRKRRVSGPRESTTPYTLGRGFFVRSVTLVGHTEKKTLEIIGNDHSDKGGLENRLEVNML